MMKNFMKRSGHWIALLLATDAAYMFAVWIIRREAMISMSLFLFLFTAGSGLAGFFAEYRRQKKWKEALLAFLEMPDDRTKEMLLQRCGEDEAVEMLCSYIFEQSAQSIRKTSELALYREYIEAWVHEAKTPLALAELVLGNHKDEMSPYVYARMNYIRHQFKEDVEQILFYARLAADHCDYKYTKFRLDECALEVIEDYRMLLEERNIAVEPDWNPVTVISDRKVVSFMLSQIIGNAVKYADGAEGKISLSVYQEKDKVYFRIYNNGEGVPPEDAPFIFDKGFTGNHPNRQSATGMGLYLVRKYAQKLCAEVRVDPNVPFESGFGIEMVFTL